MKCQTYILEKNKKTYVVFFIWWFNLQSAKSKSFRKHNYSIVLNFLPPKNENFQIKNSDSFHISAQNIDCGYSLESPWRVGSNEYPQFMFLSRNKHNNV